MREITDKELLQLQLDILKKVDTFCRKVGIKYTVDGGTCIGAVRHKGYIPWDDDIDICMTRPNYERFIHSFNGNIENLEVFAPELDWNYYAPYANVVDTRTVLEEGANGHHGQEIGVKIDIFPIDGVATDIKEYRKNRNRQIYLWSALYAKRLKLREVWKNQKKAAIYWFWRKIQICHRSYASLQKEIRGLATRYPFEEAQYVEDFIHPMPREVRCSRQAFENYHDVPFEDITVSILDGYDEYLSNLYGNYMQLPPEKQRVAHHGFQAFWKD